MDETWRVKKSGNQHSTYFQETFRATITEEALTEVYKRLGQWQCVIIVNIEQQSYLPYNLYINF